LLSNQKNMQWLEFTAFDCRNARSASGMGRTLLSHPVLVWVNVCCSPEQPFREQVANDAKGQTRTFNHVGATSAPPLVTANGGHCCGSERCQHRRSHQTKPWNAPQIAGSHRVFCCFHRTSPDNLSGRLSLKHGRFFRERINARALFGGGLFDDDKFCKAR
jgi:hypothetical protein